MPIVRVRQGSCEKYPNDHGEHGLLRSSWPTVVILNKTHVADFGGAVGPCQSGHVLNVWYSGMFLLRLQDLKCNPLFTNDSCPLLTLVDTFFTVRAQCPQTLFEHRSENAKVFGNPVHLWPNFQNRRAGPPVLWTMLIVQSDLPHNFPKWVATYMCHNFRNLMIFLICVRACHAPKCPGR